MPTYKTADRVFETSETTGAGDYDLDGAPIGYQSFAGALGANNLCPYFAEDGVNWEAGIGTVLAGPARLARTAILASSNAGAAVNWGAGTKNVRCGLPASLAAPRQLSKAVGGGVNVTLSQDEQRREVLKFTGVLTANINVIVDETPWGWIVHNATTGNFTLTFKTAAGAGVAVPQGGRNRLYCDGVDVLPVIPNTQAKGDLLVGGAAGLLQRKAIGSDAWVLMAEAAQADGLAWRAIPLPRSYLAGFTLANNAADATNDIDIAAGAARDSTNAANIVGAAMAKRLDANWAAGTGQGMRNSAAAITDTTYHIYAVAKALGADPDYYAHTSAVVATVLAALQAEAGGAAYLYVRRVGSILREGGAIAPFFQDGDHFYRKAHVQDVNAANPGTLAVSRTLSVPAGVRVEALLIGNISASAASSVSGYVTDLSKNDQLTANAALIANVNDFQNHQLRVFTDTSRQIRTRVSFSDASTGIAITTYGWIDRRGRDD